MQSAEIPLKYKEQSTSIRCCATYTSFQRNIHVFQTTVFSLRNTRLIAHSTFLILKGREKPPCSLQKGRRRTITLVTMSGVSKGRQLVEVESLLLEHAGLAKLAKSCCYFRQPLAALLPRRFVMCLRKHAFSTPQCLLFLCSWIAFCRQLLFTGYKGSEPANHVNFPQFSFPNPVRFC